MISFTFTELPRRAFARGVRAVASAFAAATAALAVVTLSAGAHAQTTDPPYKPFGVLPSSTAPLSTEKPSPVNAFPMSHGNAQNRSWSAGDVYWGVLDDNFPNFDLPFERFSSFNDYITDSGWSFPRLADQNNQLNSVGTPGDPNSVSRTTQQAITAYAYTDGVSQGTAFYSVTAGTVGTLPSTDILSTVGGASGYYEAAAFPRPAANAIDYDATQKFVWRLDNPAAMTTANGSTLTIPGVAGAQVSYRIFVHIPTPLSPLGTINGVPETRIDDARYTVYYYVRSGNTYLAREQVCAAVAQTGGGDFELKALDGSTATFPFFTSATFSAGTGLPSVPVSGQPANGTPNLPVLLVQGVAIDNTTTDTDTPQFVLADSITLEPNFDTVSATPTITPQHGGRKYYTPGGGTTPTQQPEYLPNSPDAVYNTTANAPHMDDTATQGVWADGSGIFSYINDINDPAYANANYGNYIPWDVSTYFQGPQSLIDARYTGTDANGKTFTGAQIGSIDPYLSDRPTVYTPLNPAAPVLNQNLKRPAKAVDATNNDVYAAPLFSHAQIIVAKTTYVQDPENGVPDNLKVGTKTVAVSAIYALDWMTGATIWRFPDRTYLPAGAVLNGVAIPEAGLRNQAEGTDITGAPVFQVPGIVAIDRNGDGLIEDDEVYIGASQIVKVGGQLVVVTTGNNTSGATNASVTIAPRVMVQGNVQIPVHDLTWTPTTSTLATDITGVTNAPAGRYFNPTAGNYSPVPVGMAFIAAGNGVMYAVDAYGNNDTRYFPGTQIGTSTASPYYGTYFGTYQAGTTNLFWTFSEVNHPEQSGESQKQYYDRLASEVPGTSNFGASAPVLAWNLTDSEMTQASLVNSAALRLFVGNTNGVLYALDPNASAGYSYGVDPVTMLPVPNGVQNLPFIKGAQVTTTSNADYWGSLGGTSVTLAHQKDLAWWFRTQGSINFTPAVSAYRHNQTAYNGGPTEKGVYASSSEGRVYCIDWDGPAFVGGTTLTNFDGTATTAKSFNDDIYNHNTIPTLAANYIADTEQGTVRPRWVYPNLYRSNSAATANKRQSDIADNAIGVGSNGAEIGGVKYAEPATLGPIQSPPMLVDFWWKDPDIAGSAPSLLDYVVVVGNDPVSSGAPATESRVYLLDQIGDRANYLTNPRISNTNGTGRVISQPRDKYSPKQLLASASDSTIPAGLAWSYRYTNEAYPSSTGTATAQQAQDIQFRNTPLFDLIGGTTNPNFNTYSLDPTVPVTSATLTALLPNTTVTTDEYMHQPTRRMLPTIFVGGIGAIYALDIDPETGLFMRWRPNVAEQTMFTPLATRIVKGIDAYPGDPTVNGTLAVNDQVLPADHIFDNTASAGFTGYTRANLTTQAILCRFLPLDVESSGITSLTITGGPVQNRNNVIPQPQVGGVTLPRVPATPTNDLPNLYPLSIATVTPPAGTTGASTVTRGDGTVLGLSAATSTVDFYGLASYPKESVLTLGGHSTPYVNQDINDPMTTLRGSRASNPTISPSTSLPNAAFQYPIMIASTIGSYIHGASLNIEGEDRESPSSVGNTLDVGNSHPMGWAFTFPGSTLYYNNGTGNSKTFTLKGPGGLSGAAVFSNAYFPAIDPYATAYRNAASNTSLNITPNFIADEPNTTAPTPSGTATTLGSPPTEDLGQARPDFKPRPQVLAQTATAASGAPATVNDLHTGQSGFPLGLNGHFFDREFAGAGGATQWPTVSTVTTYGFDTTYNFNKDGQHPLGDYHVWPRVPGYSNIGSRLSNGNVNLGLTYGDPMNANFTAPNNQVPDGMRIALNPGGGSDVALPILSTATKTASFDMISDDINPVAQDVAWFYVGSDDGTVYGYTPAILGHDTGLEGGVRYALSPFSPSGGYYGPVPNQATADNPPINGTQPQVDLYTQNAFQAILNQLNAGGNVPRDKWQTESIAALGGKNYYEWGDTAYIVIYDLLAQPAYSVTSTNQRYVPTLGTQLANGAPQAGYDRSVTVTFSSTDGTTLPPRVLSLAGTNDVTGNGTGGTLLAYYYGSDGLFHGYNYASPPTNGEVPLGIAILKMPIGLATGASTPGSRIQIHVTQTVLPSSTGTLAAGGGSVLQQLRNNPAAFFTIANPLAVQGWLTGTAPSTTGNQTYVTIPTPNNGYNVNGIGPYESSTEQFAGQANSFKSNVSTTVDPDIRGSEYWQALTNGNTIHRVDDRPYLLDTSKNPPVPFIPLQPNGNLGNPISVAGQGAEPSYFLPVAASGSYINHGTNGGTASGNNLQNLRIQNRGLTTNLPRVRVAPSTLLFRAWPGEIMNANADATANPRLTPGEGTLLGMADSGQINPLPWEAVPAEAKPWSAATLINNSPDYKDIDARKNNAVQVFGPSGDLVIAPGALPAVLTGPTNDANGTPIYVNNDIGAAGSSPTTGISSSITTFVSITVPKYQPANLVAAHNLTSTYQASNMLDFSSTNLSPDIGAAPGPLQLPRGVTNRMLTYYGTNTQALTPAGYTSRMAVFVDVNNTGQISSTASNAYNRTSGTDLNNTVTSQTNGSLQPYREFEVWMGVPVDQSLKVVESVVDLGSLPHGFGMENGLLGYNPAQGDARMYGLIPPPLSNNADYANYFKNFTVQNTGNVNLYNLRASQKVEALGGDGAGTPFSYFQMRAKDVNPAMGVSAANADPNLGALVPYVNANVMPTIVTYLDPQFDSRWDAFASSNYGTLYSSYYHLFGGRHAASKAPVGAATPSVVGIPTLPANQTLPGAPTPIATAVAMGVPFGTPFGLYSSTQANSAFTIFEDHDTNSTVVSNGYAGYQATPVITGGSGLNLTILAAGPLYGGQNKNPFTGNAPAGAAPLTILSNGGGTNNGVWRAQRYNATTGTYEYLPYTYPYLNIKAQVTESALTSQFPDLALPANASFIATGVLPGVDPFPVVTADNSTGSVIYRPSSALTPASWRDSAGNMHVYYSSNRTTNTASVNGSPYGAQPGAPYELLHTELTWDAKTGSWKAASIGTEIAAASSATGHWFTSPVVLPNGGSVNPAPVGNYESNTSPSLLTHTVGGLNAGVPNYTVDQATLFFLDTVPTQSGSPIGRLFYLDVTSNGVGGTPQEYFVNADPSIQRYAPKAVFDSTNSQDFLMYYGGKPGRWSIYYVPRAATNGLPTGTAQDASTTPGVEIPLPLPSAIVSATEPSPVYRTLTTPSGTQNVVDVYYTGISRATQTPDLYMNRYTVAPGKLTIAPLPAVSNDPLSGGNRQNLWQARNIAWVVNGANGAALPTINVLNGGTTLYTVGPNNWKFDTTSGLLYQTVGNTPATLTYISVDAAAGTVRFRGGMAPAYGNTVTASYTPQVYRLTSDGAGNYGVYTMPDPQTLPATPTGLGYVLRRTQAMLSGRNYIFWQKGALAGKAPTLYSAVRRVGLDLVNPATDPAAPGAVPNPNAIGTNQSIQLSQATANANGTGDQTPVVASVVVNGVSVPFDVDFNRNRIYVEPQYEGQPVDITYTRATAGESGTATPNGVQVTLHGLLTPIDELNTGSAGSFGAALGMVAGINEGQAAAMIDLIDPTRISGFSARNDPPSSGDPTLAPGRVWVFWTSPRGRAGQAAKPDPYPSGFNLYWETIAPDFDGLQLYTPVSHN